MSLSRQNQCCLGRSGSYLRSRPREAKPNRKVWTNHMQQVAVSLMPLLLQRRKQWTKVKPAAVSLCPKLFPHRYTFTFDFVCNLKIFMDNFKSKMWGMMVMFNDQNWTNSIQDCFIYGCTFSFFKDDKLRHKVKTREKGSFQMLNYFWHLACLRWVFWGEIWHFYKLFTSPSSRQI